MGTEVSGLFFYRRTAAYRVKASRGEKLPAWVFKDWQSYQAEVAKRVDVLGRQYEVCRKCGCTIQGIGVYWQGTRTWVVVDTNTSADGLTYCPPNPDHLGKFGDHKPVR